jgi:hypothetical protein
LSANLVTPGIEPGTSESVARNPDYLTTEAVLDNRITRNNFPGLIKIRESNNLLFLLLEYYLHKVICIYLGKQSRNDEVIKGGFHF